MTSPRESYVLEGAQQAEDAFAAALKRGRLHHAWLLTGPEGVGKATFAFRAARRLLGAAPNEAFGTLGASPEDPVCRQIVARSHPDLVVIERMGPDGKMRRGIPVEEARQLPEFFSKAPATAPFRVAIIDAADDLNVNAANAVLKTLEEPPERGVLFLVSHSPGRLLPTIRSRCRTLRFAPWAEADVAEFLARRDDISEHDAGLLAKMAHGSPGMGLALAGDNAIDIDHLAHEILRKLPERDESELLSLADSFRGAAGARRFELLFERLADQISEMARTNAMQGETAGLDGWARAWEGLVRAPRETEALNLDRADVFWTTMASLGEAARAQTRC